MTDLTHTFAHKLEETHWGKAVFAALVAGMVFLIMQMFITGLIHGYHPALPLKMIAGIVLGTEALSTIGFSLEIFLTAFLVHFGLSLLTAWIMAPIIQDMALGKALLVGAGIGLIIYLVNFFLLTEAYTWFQGLRSWSTLINHLIFGAVMAWVYEARRLKG